MVYIRYMPHTGEACVVGVEDQATFRLLVPSTLASMTDTCCSFQPLSTQWLRR